MTTSRHERFSAFTTPEFWNDPHISGRMLENHLDLDALGLAAGSRVLDLRVRPRPRLRASVDNVMTNYSQRPALPRGLLADP
ncbi:MAG: hypothetical protein ACRDRN_27975 [Sciscionella sp.]